jgi:hypothetical protein
LYKQQAVLLINKQIALGFLNSFLISQLTHPRYSTPTATDAVRDSTFAHSSLGDEWGVSACERDEERRLGRAMVLTLVVGIGVFALGVLVGTKVASNRL